MRGNCDKYIKNPAHRSCKKTTKKNNIYICVYIYINKQEQNGSFSHRSLSLGCRDVMQCAMLTHRQVSMSEARECVLFGRDFHPLSYSTRVEGTQSFIVSSWKYIIRHRDIIQSRRGRARLSSQAAGEARQPSEVQLAEGPRFYSLQFCLPSKRPSRIENLADFSSLVPFVLRHQWMRDARETTVIVAYEKHDWYRE